MDKPTGGHPHEDDQAQEKVNANGAFASEEPADLESAKQLLNEKAADLTRLTEQLESVSQEGAALKDKYLRAMAEMENTRRRMDREKSDLLQYGLERLMNDLLPVLDSTENALVDINQLGKSDTNNLQSMVSGFELMRKQLLDVLGRHGLAQIQSEGADFDPNLHQAIQRIESDDIDREKVKQVFAKGYTLNGRLLRPAMVSVEVPKN